MAPAIENTTFLTTAFLLLLVGSTIEVGWREIVAGNVLPQLLQYLALLEFCARHFSQTTFSIIIMFSPKLIILRKQKNSPNISFFILKLFLVICSLYFQTLNNNNYEKNNSFCAEGSIS